MKRINDDELDFVVRHYKQGCLNTDRAWQRLQTMRHIRSGGNMRRIAAAAAIAVAVGMAVAAGIAGYRSLMGTGHDAPSAAPTDSAAASPRHSADSVAVFHFDDTPINEVLGKLSRHYSVQLSASDTTKRVSGEIEAASADDAIEVLETTLDIKINK